MTSYEHMFPRLMALEETRLKEREIEGMRRSAAMAPLPPQRVNELLDSHAELSHDWAEVEALLKRLGRAWTELRSLLNEINAVLVRS